MALTPNNVHETLSQHLLTDGYDIVCDLEKSRGCWLHDAKSGRDFLDMFTFFATLPLGFNHPALMETEFLKKLTRAAITKVSNSDIYTLEYAEAIDIFGRVAIPEELPHVFFIEGGALGVENALKAAFDWKVKKNFARGITGEKGYQVIHFKNAFHGRSGYTLSLTNTADPRKYQYFAKFDWPRIDTPALAFPVTAQNLANTKQAEAKAVDQIHAALKQNPHDIAAIIIEPIQSEGGDNHFRPEFLKALRTICDEHEMLLIFDEVQTGIGLTGTMWAYQQLGVVPDLLAFGKKTQVCGVLAGKRLDEITNNVFTESSRINSTFGGNLVDFVRVGKILEVIERDNLLANAQKIGGYLLAELQKLSAKHPSITNARGRGLLCAIDLPSTDERNRVIDKCYDLGMIILPCGTRSIRFRPALTVTEKEINLAVEILQKAVKAHV
ncbi:MAG: L-lysine 6-transaminase [Deltaproteobacteria bacterium]|nr:L-lysine 6-transaminase [Deltaproteobacteria bacterium]